MKTVILTLTIRSTVNLRLPQKLIEFAPENQLFPRILHQSALFLKMSGKSSTTKSRKKADNPPISQDAARQALEEEERRLQAEAEEEADPTQAPLEETPQAAEDAESAETPPTIAPAIVPPTEVIDPHQQEKAHS